MNNPHPPAMPSLAPASALRFPFAALVGHERLRLALLLAAVDPGIGGVLITGPRGTAKSTAARALADLLPGAPFVGLPLAASVEQLVGTLDLEDVLRTGQVRLAPGLLARAHGGVLYVDEVNLLPDALVDALLDVAASGINTIERDGISRQHAARFVLVGTMNPEEGELRPQLLDRFGLSVALDNPTDTALRQAILHTRLAFDHDPAALVAQHAPEQARLVARVAAAQGLLGAMAWPQAVVLQAAERALAAGVDGLRGDLVLLKAARAHAAWVGRTQVDASDLDAVASLALDHRRTHPDTPSHAARQTPPPPPGATPSPAHTPHAHQGGVGDWGALPPQAQDMARVAHTGGWSPKKA